jgi:hypothetical protein
MWLAATLALVCTCSTLALADAEVSKSGSTWSASVDGSSVYTGTRFYDAVNAAADNMGVGTINIRNSGESGEDGGVVYAIEPQAGQTLDFHGNTIDANSTGFLDVGIYCKNKDNITVKNVHVIGSPRYGFWFRGCSNVVFEDITMDLSRDTPVGLGIRVDASTSSASNLTLQGNININGSNGHAIEIYSIEGFTFGDITVTNSGNAGVLLNDSRNGTVGNVIGSYNSPTGGYATFRTANTNGPNVVVESVYSRNSGRGFFTVSGSGGTTINSVDIADTNIQGILLQDAYDTHVLSGIVSNGNPNCQWVGTTSTSDSSLNVSGCTIQGTPPSSSSPSIDLTTSVNGSDVDLSWVVNNISPSNQEVYRDTDPDLSGRVRIATSVSGTTYTDTGLADETYYYSIKITDTGSVIYNSLAEIAVISTGGGSDSTIVIEEAENGFCGVDGSVDNSNSGYTATGYANTDNQNGKGVDYQISVPAAGSYQFMVRHANGNSSRSGVYIVNGSNQDSITLPATGAWTTYEDSTTVNLDLLSGTNTIRLEATNNSGLSNIDSLTITGVDPIPVNCN